MSLLDYHLFDRQSSSYARAKYTTEQLTVTDSNRHIQLQVDSLLHLCRQEPKLEVADLSGIQASLAKAISPTFEIVFAGAFSAGKSMLINALLERELLYSAEGHATGTQGY